MTKRYIFECFVDTVANLSVYQKATDSHLFDCRKLTGTPLCLVTVSFDNLFLIEQHIRLVKKNITDKQYVQIIADNSTNPANRDKIKQLCIKENIVYVGLPYNFFQKTMYKPSYAHGLCLTWIYHNIIGKIAPRIFGFLDHDIFPISEYNIANRLGNQDFFGRLVDRTPSDSLRRLWYLWAGFCFFSYHRVKSKKMNFFPTKIDGVYLDTGGSLYKSLYKYYNLSDLSLDVPVREVSFREGNNYHADRIHFIDNDWVHTINGSNWAKVESKDEFLKDFLSKY